LAQALAEGCGLPYVELDELYHQPGWVQKDRRSMAADVQELLGSTAEWVIDGNYNSSGGRQVRSIADMIVFLDLPRSLVMRRIVWRTLRRAALREELWNGNREPWTNLTSLAPDKNIIRFAWDNHARYSRRYHEQIQTGEWDHAEVVTLRSSDEVERWLETMIGS
jgi:adenylate kinase family enzyme